MEKILTIIQSQHARLNAFQASHPENPDHTNRQEFFSSPSERQASENAIMAAWHATA